MSTPLVSHAYTSCDGIQDGDVAQLTIYGTKKSDGSVFQPEITDKFTMNKDKLIDGFYENVLGMKIGEKKTFEVPPNKGYSSGELAGETLIFEVYVDNVLQTIRDCSGAANAGGFGTTLWKIIQWTAGAVVVGFIGVTFYLSLQKNTTPKCAHCKAAGRTSKLSDGKCGKCGNYYCRQSFSRGCPNCGSNTFVPNK